MEDEEVVVSKGAGDPSESPLLSHLLVVRMEDTTDKLKLLDYEKKFCKALKFRPFPRHYFAVPTNSGEQFHLFTNLAVWILNLCGRKIEQPQEFDDPNATIATLIEEAKKLGINTKFPPAKLKTGSGDQVVNILSAFCDCALAKKKFTWNRPSYPHDDTHEEVIQEVEGEVTMEDEIQEEVMEESEEEGGGTFLDMTTDHDGLNPEGSKEVILSDVMEATVDPEQWRLEVERVLPSLKMQHRHDNRDWRIHYEQMHQYHDGIKSILSETRVYLDKLHQDIAKTQEKISSREKYINQQLEGQVHTFRTTNDELAQAREKYKQSSGSVNELVQQLNQISSELESVKAEMDERGTTMTDAGPVVRVKQGLTKLKNECTQMDIQIGLMEHSLLEAKFKTKSVMKMQMSAGSTKTSTSTALF